MAIGLGLARLAKPIGALDSTGCPFGGNIVIQGKAPQNPQDVLYHIRIRQHQEPGTETLVTTQFNVVDINTGQDTPRNPDQTTGYLPYLGRESNWNKTLAWWHTSGNGWWQVRLETLTGGVKQNGPWYRTQVKKSAPYLSIARTGPSTCEDIIPGTEVSGIFMASDDPYFGYRSLQLAPPGNQIEEPNGPATTSSATDAIWRASTSHLTACGYSVDLHASDRTIVNSEPGINNSIYKNTVFRLQAAAGKGLGWDNCEVMDE